MKRQTYEVEFHDGLVETVTVDGNDFMFYEDETGESSLDLLTNMRKMSSWYVITHAALSRAGRYEGTFEEYRAAVAFVLPVSDPTQPDATPKEDSEPSA